MSVVQFMLCSAAPPHPREPKKNLVTYAYCVAEARCLNLL